MDTHNWPALEALPARIVRGILSSRNVIYNSDLRIVNEAGLTWVQFSTLVSLRFTPPDYILSPTELYSRVQVTSGGLTKALHALSDNGFIDRVPSPDDARSQLVKLTDKGVAMVEKLVLRFNQSNGEKIAAILSDQEAETLAQLLQKLSAGLQKNNNK